MLEIYYIALRLNYYKPFPIAKQYIIASIMTLVMALAMTLVIFTWYADLR
jgi:hypothetical protein